MKKKFVLLITLYTFLMYFLHYKDIQIKIIEICILFFRNVFPPLFSFFIISNILINYDVLIIIKYLFYPLLNKLYGLNQYTSYIFIMSMLSGIPSSAKYTCELLDKKLITNKEANNIILFSHFANPLFILSISYNKPYLLLICHYLPNFIIALFFKNKENNHTSYKDDIKSINLIEVLNESIINSFNTLMMILGLIIVFYILSYLSNIFILRYLLEMTSSIFYISNINISLKLKTMLIGGILSFGGLCSHMQVFSILKNKKIRYLPYLLARLSHFSLTIILIYFLY